MNFSFSAIISKFKGLLGREDKSRVPVKKKTPATGTAEKKPVETSSEQAIRPNAAGKKRAKARTKKKRAARGKKSK